MTFAVFQNLSLQGAERVVRLWKRTNTWVASAMPCTKGGSSRSLHSVLTQSCVPLVCSSLPRGYFSFSCNLSLSYLLWFFDDHWSLIIPFIWGAVHWLTGHAICVQEVETLLSELGASSLGQQFTSCIGGGEGLYFFFSALYSLYP